eukprot:4194428-Pyramimonas_sp.AAC.1
MGLLGACGWPPVALLVPLFLRRGRVIRLIGGGGCSQCGIQAKREGPPGSSETFCQNLRGCSGKFKCSPMMFVGPPYGFAAALELSKTTQGRPKCIPKRRQQGNAYRCFRFFVAEVFVFSRFESSGRPRRPKKLQRPPP